MKLPQLDVKRIALGLGILNCSVLALFIVLMRINGENPGPMQGIALGLLLYLIVSPLFAFSAAVSGLFESFTAPRRLAVIGVGLNIVYLIFMARMWDAWTGL